MMQNNLNRTAYCGAFRAADAGKEVVVCGWVQRRRPFGGLIFIALRDRTGVLQLTFDENQDKALFDQAYDLRPEDVIRAVGTVRLRSDETRNPKMETGDVEIAVSSLTVLGKSETPPFEIVEHSKANEELRLKYRYLDLRRPDLQKNILFRHRVTKIVRDYFDENGFIEIETPMLIRSTPEGARDFLVPSRIHPGEFYALPQSPQLYKQLSMVAGFDRYMQVARCFRDEDLRADRQPEFTQIDFEMSFVEVEDVLNIGEGLIRRVFRDALGIDILTPLPRMTYRDAMERYGTDKPDVRFGMEIINLSDTVRDFGFSVFSAAVKAGGSVRALRAEGAASVLTRKEMDKLTDFVKGVGAKGLAWVRLTEEGIASSFGKFVTEEEMSSLVAATGAQVGDAVLIIADGNNTHALTACGSLRTHLAKKLDLKLEGYRFLWIVEFPFFEYDEEAGSWVAMHHPFTAPLDECLEYLESDQGKVRAKCYDLVLNGIELSSGSIRITDPALQSRMFRLLGLSDEEAHAKFGYLLDAFRFGAPPHGGMGIGLDRLIMQMLGCDSLRDVVAYPKVQNASELMTDCPAPVDADQLRILHISTLDE